MFDYKDAEKTVDDINDEYDDSFNDNYDSIDEFPWIGEIENESDKSIWIDIENGIIIEINVNSILSSPNGTDVNLINLAYEKYKNDL